VRRIELPRGRWEEIAEEDDLTVQEQWDIEHAGIASESVAAKTTVLQLEELRSLETALPDAARTLETDLRAIVAAKSTPAARKREAEARLKLMTDARATNALALAYQKLGPEEYASIDRFEVVRVMCSLRAWDVTGPDGQVIPIPPDRTPESVAAFARTVPNTVMKAISAETARTNVTPTDFNRSPEAVRDPKAPTGESNGSGSAEESKSASASTAPATGSRSPRKRSASSPRTAS